jgi:hypothetical protein
MPVGGKLKVSDAPGFGMVLAGRGQLELVE